MSIAAPAEDGELEVDAVSKRYGHVKALESCSLKLGRGEILALLGPSGCGKSTLLNMIAGFETVDEGSIRLRGVTLNDVPPHRRDIGMVFQSYALFPHMTAAENIAYGLEARRLEQSAIRGRIDEMAALLKLDMLLARYPAQLSGGQRQRVAIARALAIRPQMLLLDEAFSALDRNLREEMQVELSLLLHRLQVSTILVTHDQREAFSLADRIAIMEGGRIGQVGTPRELYEEPATDHVLRFLGTTNRLQAGVSVRDGICKVRLGSIAFALPQGRPQPQIGGEATIYLRTEDIALSPTPTAVHPAEPGIVTLVTFLGSQERIVFTLAGQEVVAERPARRGAPAAKPGDGVYVDFDPTLCRFAGNDLRGEPA